MPLSALELTRQLVRFDTVNPPGNERACAEHLARILEGAGFGVELIPFGEARAQLVARIGASNGKAPLAFTGHLDTIPLGAQPWTCDPFAADIRDGKVFGRGASDMKSGVAAFVAAALELAHRIGHRPGLCLIITAGEEVGCAGAFALAAERGRLGKAGALVVAEPTGNRPLVGHKGAFWLNATTRGVTAHGSMPEKGINAVYKAARAVTALEQFDFNVARHDVLGAPTLNVGTIQGGLNINSVPDRAVIGIDIRTIPAQRHAQIRQQLASYLGGVEFDTRLDVEGVWTDPADPWMREVFGIVADVTGNAPTIAAAPYFTDASALAPALGAPPTVILGPGELEQAHQTDEFCQVDRIAEAANIYAALIRKWCSL